MQNQTFRNASFIETMFHVYIEKLIGKTHFRGFDGDNSHSFIHLAGSESLRHNTLKLDFKISARVSSKMPGDEVIGCLEMLTLSARILRGCLNDGFADIIDRVHIHNTAEKPHHITTYIKVYVDVNDFKKFVLHGRNEFLAEIINQAFSELPKAKANDVREHLEADKVVMLQMQNTNGTPAPRAFSLSDFDDRPVKQESEENVP